MPTDDSIPERRLAPLQIPARLARQWWIDFRFVREVERLEREGRVKSRGDLERQMGIKAGTIAAIRQGRLGCITAHIVELKRIYNADYKYILFGQRLPGEGEPILFDQPSAKGRKLDTYPGFAYEYGQPAGWKIGPQAEADKRHFPEDPENKRWHPHAKASKYVQRPAKQEEPAPEA